MQIHIETQGVDSRATLSAHAKKRLGYALGHANNHIDNIRVRLSDINGPRGGTDKCCHLTIDIKGLEPVIIEDIQTDIVSAIDRAADRAGRSVTRRISRSRRFSRTVPIIDNSHYGEKP